MHVFKSYSNFNCTVRLSHPQRICDYEAVSLALSILSCLGITMLTGI
jgi:hypothetical protein